MKAKALLAWLFLVASTPVFAAVGDYAEVACDKAFFTANDCKQCFDGGKVKAGDKISGLYDKWSNTNATDQVMYVDEQTYPEMVNLGGANTTWTSNPTDPKAFWKYGDEVIPVASETGTGRQEFVLGAGKSVTFMESDLGASYSLDKTDRADGDVVGLAKFPLNYHDLDQNGNEGAKITHNECVAFYASAPAPTQVTPPTPKPKEVTKVKTGPGDVFVLLGIAFLLSLAFLAVRRKNA